MKLGYKIIRSKEVTWCATDDRYVLVIKEDGEITGINFMQGEGLGCFEERYSKPCPLVTKFVLAVLPDYPSDCELDSINNAIWAWCRYTLE